MSVSCRTYPHPSSAFFLGFFLPCLTPRAKNKSCLSRWFPFVADQDVKHFCCTARKMLNTPDSSQRLSTPAFRRVWLWEKNHTTTHHENDYFLPPLRRKRLDTHIVGWHCPPSRHKPKRNHLL